MNIKRRSPFGGKATVEIETGKKGLVKNIASLGIVQLANYVLPLLSIPIISRIIGPEKFGVINFSASFMAYFTLLIGFGFDLSATRKIAAAPSDSENRNRVFSEVFFCQMWLTIFCTVCFLVCLLTVPQLKSESKVAVFSFLVCISTFLTQNWLFQAMQDLSKVALLNFISKLLFTAIVLLIVSSKGKYIWYPLVLNAVNIIIAAISFTWGYKRYHIKLRFVALKKCLELLWQEKMIFFSLVVISLYTTTNIVILGLYHNARQVAFYTSAQRLIAIVQSLLTMPFYQALYPFIGRAFGESEKKGMMIAQKTVPLILIITATASLAMFFFGPWFLVLFYGNAFAPAVPVIRILAFVPMIISISNIFGIQIMLNMKMDKYFFYITACGAMFSVLLNFILLPPFGYIGSAINWLITELIVNVSMYIVLRSKGLNPLNPKYFAVSALMETVRPLSNKIFRRGVAQGI
ncbi:MAG TPA: flippase [Puia sp.]|nr:flippase [Puia sp.]